MEVIVSADEAFVPLRDMAMRALSAVCSLLWRAPPEQHHPGLRAGRCRASLAAAKVQGHVDGVQVYALRPRSHAQGSRGLCGLVQLRNLDCELAGDTDCWPHPGLLSRELRGQRRTSAPAARGTQPELVLGPGVGGDLPGAGQPIARVTFTLPPPRDLVERSDMSVTSSSEWWEHVVL